MENKVWGTKENIFESNINNVKIDILYLKKDTFCSWHYHNTKYNKFRVLSGKISIKIENPFEKMIIDDIILSPKISGFTVVPTIKHQFIALEDSVVIEIMYTVNNQLLYDDDIVRLKQGGKIIDGIEVRECELPVEK